MKVLTHLLVVLVACLLSCPLLAADDDAVAAVFVFGRVGGWTTSGFGVGDGSYVVTTIDAVRQPVAGGKKIPISHAVVVSRWTGEPYSATVAATDDEGKVALLKLRSQAVPAVPVAGDEAFSRAPKATLGELLSGDEVGGRFPSEMYALDVERKPPKFTVKTWRATNACLTEVRGRDWLFLSKVYPAEKAPKAALVVKRRAGAIGMFHGRLVIEGGARPATFYRVLPATALRAFLSKAGLSAGALSQPPAIGPKAADAESSFQAACLALSASLVDAPAAVENAAALVKLRPKNAIAHMLLGSALSRQGKLDDALKSINTALELDPALPDGRLNRGLALVALGKSAESEQELRKAVQDDPKDVPALLALAGLLAASDKTLEEAVGLARQAVRLAPDDPGAHLDLAQILKRKKDFDGAIAELRGLVDTAPKWGQARAALAATYEAAGKPDLAEAEYRKLVELEPQNPNAHLALIECLLSAGKKDEASQSIERLKKLKLRPDLVEAVKKLEARLKDTEKKD
jgi:Flp pilus assembly protein TadD